MSGELELGDSVMRYSQEGGGLADLLADAIDNASDQDRITWLTENGKRVAAVVPVDVAEAYETWAGRLLSDSYRTPVADLRRQVQERLTAAGHPDMAQLVPADPAILASYAGLLTDAERGRRARTP